MLRDYAVNWDLMNTEARLAFCAAHATQLHDISTTLDFYYLPPFLQVLLRGAGITRPSIVFHSFQFTLPDPNNPGEYNPTTD